MAITFDAVTNGGALSSVGSPQTLSHTTTGSNRTLYVSFLQISTGAGDVVTGITYNGVAMTRVGSIANTSAGTDFRIYLYKLINPASGSNTVSVFWSSGTFTCQIIAQSYAGTKQSGTSPNNTGTASAATSLTTSVTTTTDQSWTVLLTGNNTASATAGTGSTLRVSDGAIGTWDSNGALSTGSNSMTVNGSSAEWRSVIDALEPLAASGSVFSPVASILLQQGQF